MGSLQAYVERLSIHKEDLLHGRINNIFRLKKALHFEYFRQNMASLIERQINTAIKIYKNIKLPMMFRRLNE